MPGIQLSGLGSGMDTQTMMDQLMAIERQPRTKLAYQQVAAEARKSALSDIQGKLNALKTAATGLGSAATWTNVQAISSSDSAKATASLNGGAPPGTYSFAVSQMASAARNTYTFTAQASAQTITFNKTTGAQEISLAAGATIDDAVAQINADQKLGMFAVNVNGQLVLSSRTTGESTSFTASAAGLTKVEEVAGKDLKYTVDGKGQIDANGNPVLDANGKPVPLSSATNLVKNALPNVDVTFKGVTADTSITVGGPSPDTSEIKNRLRAFVEAYNSAMDGMRSRYEEKRVGSPKNNVEASVGSLQSDTTLSNAMMSLRGSVMNEVGGTGSDLKWLSQLGISTGASTAGGALNQDAIKGKLVFDEKAFDEAFAKDPTQVQKLLSGSNGQEGFGARFAALVGTYSNTDGAIGSSLPAADSQIDRIKDSLTRFDDRLERRRAQLERQFTAMESALSKSKALSNQLAGQIAGLMR